MVVEAGGEREKREERGRIERGQGRVQSGKEREVWGERETDRDRDTERGEGWMDGGREGGREGGRVCGER